jgi:hypothetical protein
MRKTDHDSCRGRKWFRGKCIVNVESQLALGTITAR